jgi:hypothetical protein
MADSADRDRESVTDIITVTVMVKVPLGLGAAGPGAGRLRLIPAISDPAAGDSDSRSPATRRRAGQPPPARDDQGAHDSIPPRLLVVLDLLFCFQGIYRDTDTHLTRSARSGPTSSQRVDSEALTLEGFTVSTVTTSTTSL